MAKRQIKATVTITCDVTIDDETKTNIEKEYLTLLDDHEAASKILFAFLNPKIDLFNEPENVDGQWDMICEFNGRLSNFIVEPED